MPQTTLVNKVISDVRAARHEAEKWAADNEQFLATLPPFKLANITLTGPIRLSDSMCEVVMPVSLRLNKTVRFLELLDAPRHRTFGRGELKLV